MQISDENEKWAEAVAAVWAEEVNKFKAEEDDEDEQSRVRRGRHRYQMYRLWNRVVWRFVDFWVLEQRKLTGRSTLNFSTCSLPCGRSS